MAKGLVGDNAGLIRDSMCNATIVVPRAGLMTLSDRYGGGLPFPTAAPSRTATLPGRYWQATI